MIVARSSYVLAGHSSGGVYIQVFAARYPDGVAGVVLLDSQPPDAIANLPGYDGEYNNGLRRIIPLFPSVARFGVMRLIYSSASPGLPLEARAEERAFWSTASHTEACATKPSGSKLPSLKRKL